MGCCAFKSSRPLVGHQALASRLLPSDKASIPQNIDFANRFCVLADANRRCKGVEKKLKLALYKDMRRVHDEMPDGYRSAMLIYRIVNMLR